MADPGSPFNGPVPTIPPDDYRKRLKATVADQFLKSIPDDPDTKDVNERRTKCNLFVRTVVRWFGFDAWKKPEQDGERAADMVAWIVNHPDRWAQVTFVGARDHAVMGHCVVAGQVYAPSGPVPAGGWKASGHVAIVAPEPLMVASGSFKTDVPLLANIGGKEVYGISLSQCFKPNPPVTCWVFTG